MYIAVEKISIITQEIWALQDLSASVYTKMCPLGQDLNSGLAGIGQKAKFITLESFLDLLLTQ